MFVTCSTQSKVGEGDSYTADVDTLQVPITVESDVYTCKPATPLKNV